MGWKGLGASEEFGGGEHSLEQVPRDGGKDAGLGDPHGGVCPEKNGEPQKMPTPCHSLVVTSTHQRLLTATPNSAVGFSSGNKPNPVHGELRCWGFTSPQLKLTSHSPLTPKDSRIW